MGQSPGHVWYSRGPAKSHSPPGRRASRICEGVGVRPGLGLGLGLGFGFGLGLGLGCRPPLGRTQAPTLTTGVAHRTHGRHGVGQAVEEEAGADDVHLLRRRRGRHQPRRTGLDELQR